MPELAKVDYLNPFIEATITAAARFRRVLIVVIIASTLAFSAFWNSRGGSWLNSRIKVANNAEAYLTLKEHKEKLRYNDSALTEISGTLNYTSLTEELRNKRLEEIWAIRKETEQIKREIQYLEQEFSKEDLTNAETWLNKRGIKRKAQLISYAERLHASRVDNIVLIHIPFFGIVLDVNDLGILGGFTFVVILMWFRFSLWRELYNLSSTFKAAKTDEDLEFCYRALAMSQVLTVPPALSKHQPRERPWGKVVRILYFLPLTVQLIIFINDCLTFNYGWDISSTNTVAGTSISLGFLFLSALLTYWCYRLSSEIDREWEETAERLEILRNVVYDQSKYEQKKRAMWLVAASKHIYIITLLFGCILIGSTTLLFGSDGNVFRPTSDTSIWVVVTVIASAIGTLSSAILGWRKDRREVREQGLKIMQLEQELATTNEESTQPPRQNRA